MGGEAWRYEKANAAMSRQGTARDADSGTVKPESD
jgi:hypothetical protein